MFAQFRSQYPQGSIKTKMLAKVDGLHVFRASILHGEITLGTATAADTDIEVAEDRAIKRALTIAGITFGMKATLIGHATNINSLPTAMINSDRASFAGKQQDFNALPPSQISNQISNQPSHLPEPSYQPEYPAANFQSDYDTTYPDDDSYEPNYPDSELNYQEPKPTPLASASIPEFTSEPIDLSDAISKIDVEMERLSWTKNQGRDYLVQTFNKRSRQQLSASEMMQFLSYLKSLPTTSKI
jgi:hypothetical protein